MTDAVLANKEPAGSAGFDDAALAATMRKQRIQVLCNLETISRKVSAAIRGLEQFRQHVMIKVV